MDTSALRRFGEAPGGRDLTALTAASWSFLLIVVTILKPPVSICSGEIFALFSSSERTIWSR